MLRSIYSYELKSLLKQPSTYFYFVVFFGVALLSMLGKGGYFDGVPETDTEIPLFNSAYEINFLFQYFNKFFLFLLPSIIGMVIYKDFKSNFHPILYSYPIKKSDYLLGKFLSALSIVFFITLSTGIAFYLGEYILGIDNPKIGRTNHWGYASSYLFFVWPNMMVFGLMMFMVVASLRNIYAGFISVILLFFIQIIIDNLYADTPVLAALFDPFGQNAVAYETRFWTISEQNARPIPMLGVVLWNRVLWASISLFLLALFYKKFQLEQETFRLLPNIGKNKSEKKAISNPIQSTINYANVNINFSFLHQARAMLKLSTIDFRFIIKSWLFQIFMLFGVLAVAFAVSRVTNRADMTFLPLTRIVLSVPMYFFSIVIMLATFVYAGMLVHRSRMAKCNQLIDTTATSNWVLLGSKILALLKVQILLLLVMMLCGIGLQLYNGYHRFEIDLYLFHLFVLTFPTLVIWATISVFIHTIMPNVYVGIFLLLLIWIGKEQLPQIGIESYLLLFNSPPQLVYSDLNAFGHGLLPNLIINAYWMIFSAIIIVLTYLIWERGFLYSSKGRFQLVVQQLNGFVSFYLALFLVLFCFLGLTIYKEENSSFKPMANNEQILKDFKVNFAKYKSTVQPKITSVKLKIELFPESNSFLTSGSYILVNQSPERIDTLLIKTGHDEITDYTLAVPSTIIQKDKALQFAVHILEKPIEPGNSIRMEFKIKNRPNTLFYQNSSVLQNGTFIRTDILPRLGYFFNDKYYEPTDSLARHTNFYSPDANLVDIETVISTSHLQTAIAPGTLIKQWTENNRNYFHYKTENKIKFAFSFNSGDFSISKSNYKGVNLEIYHHENHTFNLMDMTEGLKASLDYNTRFFGSYQHDEIRTVEFPITQGTYASVMGNTIPTSEGRFILRNGEAKNQINLSFYIQAHELTHQWWGNQLVPADALGAKMLTESITEYITLRIYEGYFGQEKAQYFLSLQLQRYLEGRTKDAGKESPLYSVRPEQEYIAYGKGAMAFNALQYYVGEEKLNSILKEFLEKYKFRTDIYPTSMDLITHLKNSIPIDFHYIIKDMMERITFYDNKIIEIKELPNNQLEIKFSLCKINSIQKNKAESYNLYITLGQYDSDGNLLQIEKIKASSGENNITIYKNPGVTTILLDPFLHFIELNVDDNHQNIVTKE